MVLFRQDSRRGQLVAAASPLAERDGVQIGMPLSESKSLLARGSRSRRSQNTCFHIFPHDPAADLYAIQKLADDLDTFSPIVGLQQETDQPDCIFLDVTGLGHLFGGESKLEQQVDAHFRELGYLPQLGLAHTVGLAQGKAQFEPENEPENKSGDLSDADEQYEALPVAALRLSEWTTETLGQLGVRTIGQLLQLPRHDLSARFGGTIHRRIDQFTGKVAEPIIAQQQLPEFYAEQMLDYPTSHKETIEVITQRLIAGICGQLAAKQQGALQWTIRLYGQHKLPLKLRVSLFQPTATAEHVVGLANMQLEQLLNPSANSRRRQRKRKVNSYIKLDGQPLQIAEITVTVTSCVLLKHRQRKLFDENPRLDQQALSHLINRLSGRLGRQQVVYPTIVSGAQPEHAYQFRPLVDPHRKRRRQITAKTATAPASHVLARPLHLLPKPIALTVSDCDKVENRSAEATFPERISGCFGDDGSEPFCHRVVNGWGPERIETGWWRGRTVHRDYWRVETDEGEQLWVYRDLKFRKWFLHGMF